MPPKGSLGSCGALCCLHLLQPWFLPCKWLSGYSIYQAHGLYLHLILATNWSLPLSFTSMPQHCRLQLEFWGALFFPVVSLAFWPLSSSPPQPWGWHSDLPAQFSLKLLSVLIFWSSWVGLLSQTQHFLPCNREASHSWSTYQRTEWPPLEKRPWFWLSSLLARLHRVCQWSSILPMHGMVGVDHLLHLSALLSPVYNNMFCLQG